MKNETLELSRALDGEISHDVITPMLASPAETSKDLRHFVMPLKNNRKVALSLDDKKRGQYSKIDTLPIEAEFASLYAYIKLQQLKISTKLNHFALKHKLYIKLIQQAFQALRTLQHSVECVR